ncbi:MAG: hypothetical protein F9K24_21660 [Leptonema illini]|uniref:Type I restriction modification DNA specificity domain-containing protein n=1 Tax=Leptonema illini TaxID=183 RepID=A0A833GX86_9LEPT|nr:MAG: hypothetical protein F9K24_21660 [Leptonema illini]
MRFQAWRRMSSKEEDKKVKPAGKRPLVPKLRFPEFRDAGEWEVKPIGQISENVIAGGTPITSEKKYWGGSIRWMNSGELNLKKVYEVKGRITEAGLQNSSTKVIPKKCVLIGLAGQGKTRGTIAMNMVELCINQSIAAIFPNEKCFSSAFLYHNLDNRYDELRSLSTGGEGRGGLNLQIIKSLAVPLPELKEQQKIADCLSSLDELISLEAQRLDALKAHKKGMMQRLFPGEGETVPRLRFPEFRDAGEWEEKSLEKVSISISSGNDKSDPAGLYNLYGSTGVIGKTSTASYKGEFILAARVGVNAGLLTKAVGEFGVTDNTLTITLKNTIHLDFVFHYLDNWSLNKLIFGSGQPLITGNQLKALSIFVPSPSEQQRIADCLSSLDELINAQSARVADLKIFKKGLMQRLFPAMKDAHQ